MNPPPLPSILFLQFPFLFHLCMPIYNLFGVILQHPPPASACSSLTPYLVFKSVHRFLPLRNFLFSPFTWHLQTRPIASVSSSSSFVGDHLSLSFSHSSSSIFLLSIPPKKSFPIIPYFFFFTFYLFFITPIFSTLLSKSPRCLTGKMRKLNPLGEVGGCFNLFGNYQFPLQLLLLLFMRP